MSTQEIPKERYQLYTAISLIDDATTSNDELVYYLRNTLLDNLGFPKEMATDTLEFALIESILKWAAQSPELCEDLLLRVRRYYEETLVE